MRKAENVQHGQERYIMAARLTSHQCRPRRGTVRVQEKLSNLWFEHVLDQGESELTHV